MQEPSRTNPELIEENTLLKQRIQELELSDSERKQTEEALAKRLVALTRPLEDSAGIAFEELFNLDDIQRLQDEFARATGVSSIITLPDGTPITAPSSWCRLCRDIIRKTEKGRANCYKSDAVIGRLNLQGPTIQPCMSGGLWDAGAGISVGGRHIANWLIGQVRDATQTEEKMRAYAREIGADEDSVVEAFREVPAMSREQLERVAQALFTIANQLSGIAYQNVQQARFITDRKRAEEALQASEELFRSYLENAPDGVYMSDVEGNFLYGNRKCEEIIGYRREELIGKNFLELNILSENSLNKAAQLLQANIEGKSTGPDEIELISKERRLIPVEINTSVVQRMGKGIILAFVRDITERKRTEERLQETLDSLRKAFGATVQAMVSAVESRDPYTAGHQIRSADLARAIATEMGLPHEKIEGIRVAGSIHDIGKLSIPAEILSKPTRLTNIEFSLIKEHARKGYEMLKDVESPWPLAQIVYQHHERMDGSGYPGNLKGDDILIEARILAVADVVEAIASNRPYRPALGLNAALAEIEKNRGTYYDDTVVDACLSLFREKGFQLEMT